MPNSVRPKRSAESTASVVGALTPATAGPLRLVEGVLHLWLQDKNYCDWVEEHYLDDLVDVLGVDSVRLLCGDARAGPAEASPAPPP